jgi:hypothetical protein
MRSRPESLRPRARLIAKPTLIAEEAQSAIAMIGAGPSCLRWFGDHRVR